jgi:methylenetetrahydrofolate dehydrogenase (NADP+)/methenyltetrahydrofolate cyclohydrolase
MIVDGKAIAAELRARIRTAVGALPRHPKLALVIVGNERSTEAFVRVKSRAAAEVGIEILFERFHEDAKEADVAAVLERLAQDATVDGIVLQLPLPKRLDAQMLTSLIPVSKDVDVLSREAIAKFRMGELPILPPVAGAIQEILERSHVDVAGKDTLVIGHGRLVGAPVALLLRHNHAHVTVIDRPIADLATYTKEADIIISGAGVPGLIRPEMLREGVVLIDAGTSSDGGAIVGDAIGECAQKASVFTPVPGGVGPVTVAMLLKNCYRMVIDQRHALGNQ